MLRKFKQKVLTALFGRKLKKKKKKIQKQSSGKKFKKTLSRWVEAGAFCAATHDLLLNSFLKHALLI